jgi:hypothetical protein
MELIIVEKNGQSKSTKPDRSPAPIGGRLVEKVSSLTPDFSQFHIQALHSNVAACNFRFFNPAHEIIARFLREFTRCQS